MVLLGLPGHRGPGPINPGLSRDCFLLGLGVGGRFPYQENICSHSAETSRLLGVGGLSGSLHSPLGTDMESRCPLSPGDPNKATGPAGSFTNLYFHSSPPLPARSVLLSRLFLDKNNKPALSDNSGHTQIPR